jgi:hypothetical protein
MLSHQLASHQRNRPRRLRAIYKTALHDIVFLILARSLHTLSFDETRSTVNPVDG